jgi:hypothetical protein
MKKFTVLFFIFSSAYAGEENNKATAIQMAPVEVLETVKVKKHIKEVKSVTKPEIKTTKRPVEPRGWHPKIKIGFTLIALGVVLAIVGLGFVGGLSAFIGLLFTIAGLLQTY